MEAQDTYSKVQGKATLGGVFAPLTHSQCTWAPKRVPEISLESNFSFVSSQDGPGVLSMDGPHLATSGGNPWSRW